MTVEAGLDALREAVKSIVISVLEEDDVIRLIEEAVDIDSKIEAAIDNSINDDKLHDSLIRDISDDVADDVSDKLLHDHNFKSDLNHKLADNYIDEINSLKNEISALKEKIELLTKMEQ